MFFENNVFPITFSIPEEKMLHSIPKKTKLLSSLIPGDSNTYIYNTEKEYYEEYQKSCFAMTTKKAGWDCMRHYEIVANGCLPYFPNLEQCPLFTMYMLPKPLMFRSNQLYERMKKDCSDNKDYLHLLIDMMAYFKEHLTTTVVSRSILQKTGFNLVKKVLFLSGCILPDYLSCLTLHGLKQGLGSDCHDYPKVPYLYKDYTGVSLYGNGFTYSKLLVPSLRNDTYDLSIIEDIQQHQYDIVMYGSYHRGMPFYDIVCKHYSMDRIILLCGEDLHYCDSSFIKGHPVFVREL